MQLSFDEYEDHLYVCIHAKLHQYLLNVVYKGSKWKLLLLPLRCAPLAFSNFSKIFTIMQLFIYNTFIKCLKYNLFDSFLIIRQLILFLLSCYK